MNETIHERINTIVGEYGSGKNTVLASLLGISEGNIRGYIKGVMPKQDVLEKIVRSLDINPEWLLTGRGEMKRGEMNNAAISSDQKEGVPYFDVDFIGG